MPAEKSSTRPATRVPTLARAEVVKMIDRARAAGFSAGALGGAVLLGLLGLCALIVYDAITVAQMLAPWLAILVAAMVAPLKKGAPLTDSSAAYRDQREAA